MQIGSMQNALGAKVDEAKALADQKQLADVARRGTDAKDAGKHFEAMFASMLAKELRSGLDEGFFGSGPGSDTFSAWMDEHVGRVMAEGGSLGIAEMVNRNTNYPTIADVEGGGVK